MYWPSFAFSLHPSFFFLSPLVHTKQPHNLLPGVVLLLLLSDSRSHTESELFKPVKFPVWTSEKPKTVLFTEQQQQWKISVTLGWRSCLCFIYKQLRQNIHYIYIILISINHSLTFIHSLWCQTLWAELWVYLRVLCDVYSCMWYVLE